MSVRLWDCAEGYSLTEHSSDPALPLNPQTVFFWTLLVRQILRYYNTHPHKRRKMQGLAAEDITPRSLSISAQEQAQIREIFELFDSDGSGTIASNEVDAAMFALGFQPSTLDSTAAKRRGSYLDLESLSEDGSRSISLEEFTLLMKGELICSSPLEEIWAAFSTLSEDSSVAAGKLPGEDAGGQEGWGSVTLDGLRRACREFDVRLTEDELICMMEEVDVDGDGSIDKEEFLNIMRNAPWF
jgi:Ca2+-binding EF-hand superfamily protein